MQADLYLKDALVVTETGEFRGGVVVKDGVVAQVVAGSPDIQATTCLALQGRVLLPGLVDSHVHFNEPGREDWEGFRTGTMAAAAGGVTTVVDMPLNSSPPTVDCVQLQRKQTAVRDQAVVDYALWGGLINNNLAHLESLCAERVVGFKAFLVSSPDFPRVDDDLVFAGMRQVRALDSLLAVHAENERVTMYLAEELRSRGRRDPLAWAESRPGHQEVEAVARVLHWAATTGATLHVVHASLPDVVRLVAAAKRRGVPVTVETCPHHLLLDLDDFQRIGPDAKCAPPLRSRETVEDLWQCVLAGKVDTFGSDHSPCPPELKRVGEGDVWQAWGGISGIQTMLPALMTEGVHKRGLSLAALTRMASANPARLLGLYPRKGIIQPGSDADFVVVNPDCRWTLTPDHLFYRHRHSAFVGHAFRGAVERTIVRGTTVYHREAIRVEPGFGRLLHRTR
ncbi:MAG: allantoinase AllB [Caldilineaceae bacterium SB0665_bin_21]|nr:allantoinase AllB [Caldilineaceae bacterium SB0665_bin_21]MYA04046.1 allantoinase AllB [Caldilineaceae bacterium SB0664_bin_22]MYC61972.1 allantoinase AllB [Caldilineaceae bacterium SB0661_bin_34]